MKEVILRLTILILVLILTIGLRISAEEEVKGLDFA